MLSSVSRRVASNPVQSPASRVQAPSGDVKTGAVQPLNAKQAESLQQVLSSLEQILEKLVKQLSGGNITPLGSSSGSSSSGSSSASQVGGASQRSGDSFCPGGQKASPSGMPSLDGGSGPSLAAPTPPGAGGDLVAGIQVTDPKLRQALEQIASHPDGAKLLAAAKANGLTSISANPGLNADGGSGTAGVTISGGGNTRIEIADPSSSELIHTLAHELGHAATTHDGNSQLEEKTIDALGERIHRDLTGQGSGFNLDVGAYGNLAGENGILNSLRDLGIRV